METLAAKIVDGVVVEVIVGTASWASENLGGEWVEVVSSHENPNSVPGVGDTYAGGEFSRSNDLEQKILLRESALAKLAALGLSEDEAKAVIG